MPPEQQPLGHADTVFSRPRVEEIQKAPERREEGPREFFRAAVSEDSARGRVAVDARRGTVVLMTGTGEAALSDLGANADTAMRGLRDRIRSSKIDQAPVVHISHGEAVWPREDMARLSTLAPFEDVKVRALAHAVLKGSGDVRAELPPMVVAKLIREEIRAEAVYGVPVDGSLPEITAEEFKKITALRHQAHEARHGSTDGAYAKALRQIQASSSFTQFVPGERLALALELSHTAIGPESQSAIDDMALPELPVGEELAVKEFVLLLAGTPVQDREAVYRGIRYDGNFQELSYEAQYVLAERLNRSGLAPAEPHIAKELLQREKFVATTNAGKDIAVIIARAAADSVVAITDDLSSRERISVDAIDDTRVSMVSKDKEELTATLYPGDMVVVVGAGEAERAVATIRAARGAGVFMLSAALKEQGFATHAVLEAT